ncbi:MAG: mechanosensitive ion channel family protein [Aphanocapsa lilacina HA4352-LM1]|jgi:small-conductance mechanosensitive channel|nr:mechanosensitive ion channel family protein [Aphanocapsa lilacina HA4352-LM1]
MISALTAATRLWAFALAVCLGCFLPVTCYGQTPSTPAEDTRPQRAAAPVVLEERTLFELKTGLGAITAAERAQAVSQRILQFAQNETLAPDSLKLSTAAGAILIEAGANLIFAVTPADATANGRPREKLAAEYLRTIAEAVTTYRQERAPLSILIRIGYTIIAALALLAGFWMLNRLFGWIREQIDSWNIGLNFANLQLLGANRVRGLLRNLARFGLLAARLLLLYIFIPIVLGFFPRTRAISTLIFDNLFASLRLVADTIVGYLPSLFIIVLVVVIAYYLARFSGFIFDEIDAGNITIPGFFRGWAKPTNKLTIFFIIALAATVAFPYLPGFNSPAFQGISVFLGVLFSLSSSAAVANIVSGVILIYTRSFDIDDLIKIGDATGIIIEKGLLVTRIRTPKNVVISIPNSAVIGNNVINYSVSRRDYNTPLTLNTTITLGYDIPWRKVHQTLIAAARSTNHIVAEPAPFVLQTSLDDYYVSYELNACTERPDLLPRIYSELHQNMQDCCNAADIEILSPRYTALRDGNHSTIPQEYLPKDYAPPGFKIDADSSALNGQNQPGRVEGA